MIGNCILAVIMTVTVMTVICIYGMINATTSKFRSNTRCSSSHADDTYEACIAPESKSIR
jgi:hypothetical protein